MLVYFTYDHLEYFMTIWYNLWPFGIVCGHLLYFCLFGSFEQIKIWQPCIGDVNEILGRLNSFKVGRTPWQLFTIKFLRNNWFGWLDEDGRRFWEAIRVARFFLVQHTKTGKIYQIVHKISQTAMKYTKWKLYV
jgi:hypothetical protein